MVVVSTHPSLLSARGPRAARRGRTDRHLPAVEELRTPGGGAPKVPRCERRLYVSAREEMCCVVRVRFTEGTKRRRVDSRIDFM